MVRFAGHAAVAIFVLWIAKDAALYPFLHSAYETRIPSAADKMVGATGVAKEALDPEGFVQIGGELWKAKTRDSLAMVRPGDTIRVEQVRGMKLVVSADPRPKDRDSRPKTKGHGLPQAPNSSMDKPAPMCPATTAARGSPTEHSLESSLEGHVLNRR